MIRLNRLFAAPVIMAVILLIIYSPASLAAGYGVYDDAGLFDDGEYEALLEKAQSLSGSAEVDIIIVTTDDAGGKTSRDYADDYYDYNGLGPDGVLLLIDMDNRNAYISTSGVMIRYLTDARINLILDDVVAELSYGGYYSASVEFLNRIGGYLDAGIPSGQHNYDSETGEIDEYERVETVRLLTAGKIIVSLAIGAVVGLAVVSGIKRSYSMKTTGYSYPYASKGSLDLSEKADELIDHHVTRTVIHVHHDNGGGGGSRSTTHSSGGGKTHGGGGRGF